MKTINSFSSKLLALTLALMASVSSFAYEFEYVNDFHIDGFGYKIISINTPDDGEGYVSLIEIADCKNDVVIPKYVSYGDRGFHVTTFGMGSVVFTNDASSVVESITIPKTTNIINKNVLAGCPNLKTVVVDSENPYYDSRENCNAIITTSQNPYFTPNTLIAGCKTTIIPNSVAEIGDNAFYNSALESITIPTGTTKIGRSAFNNSILLSSITLSATLIEISDWAFADCLSLNTIICYAIEPPTISSNTFFGSNPIYNNPTIYVPAESVEAYKNADQWKDFGQILPIEPTTDYKSQWCNEWNVMFSNGSVYPPSNMPYRYQLAKDTVIGEHTYTSVVSKAINDALDAPRYVAAVRFTDDRKVYIYYDNAEYLLYDFNVQEGDELEVFAGINNYRFGIKTYKCIVTGVEQYACIGCPATITLHVHNHPDDFTEIYRRTQWQEGVGDVYSGFLNGVNGYVPVDGGGSVHLLCAYQGDELKYTGDLYEEYGCGDNAEQNPADLFPTLWGLQRTEVEFHTDGASAPSLVSFNEYTPTFVNGKWYLYDGRNYLREENNQVLLYSPEFEIYEDVVLYDWALEIGDTLPFTIRPFDDDKMRGAVFRVTDVSTITLLDGKEYKKWTLACGIEYIEGIGAINGEGFGNYFCIQHTAHPATYIDTRLVCASRNGKLLYQMDNAEMERLGAECLCDYNRGPRKDNAKDGQIGGRPTPTQWNQLEVVLRQMDNNHTILQAETFSYTLEDISQQVNNKTYFQLARQSTKDTATTKSVVGALHFGKDEDNRVYFLRDGVEYVLYDFTAEPGDTVEIFAGINNYPQETTYTHVVTGKDTLENSACRMLLEVVFPDETNTTAENAEKVWLAGLGSVDGIVHNAAKRTSNAHAAPSRSASSSETESSVMLCAWREDSCLYTTNHPDYDTFGCVYNQDPTAVEDISTSQSSYQKLLRDGQLFIIHDGKTYNVLGVPVE